ncbi:hypothetical protein HOY80DRAFT_1060853 [Tuber brumale]|nr:hypothetical protein HOY80DRAFT_1060853 [Tuber brumale]
MPVPVSSVLNLTNRQMIVESKASELAKSSSTTATTDRYTPSPTKSQLMGSFSTAATGNRSGGREGLGSPPLYRDLATVIPTDIDPLEVVAAVAGYNKPTHRHNQSLGPRREGQGTVEVMEFVKSCFDGEAVVVKEVGGWKAGWEENIRRIVQASHAEKRNGVIRFVELDEPVEKEVKNLMSGESVALLCLRFIVRLILICSFDWGASG